jgi:thiol-disulfide isomerase/thioredoxin
MDAAVVIREKEAEARYREEMRRSFVAELRKLPPLPTQWNHRRFDPKQKQVLVFFASWCPHCLKKAREWAEAQVPERLSKRVLWIEVFGDTTNRDRLNSFCRNANWDADSCSQIVQLKGPELAPEFYQSLGLYTVPRVVVTNSKSDIVAASWEWPSAASGRLIRDLEWLLEEAGSHQALLR